LITRDSFAKEYDKFAKALTRRVKAYLRDPNAENVHRLRTATRRLQAAFALLPKATRKQNKAQKAMSRIRELMKVNASVRDQDIILSKLSMYKQNPRYERLIEDLRKSRKSHSIVGSEKSGTSCETEKSFRNRAPEKIRQSSEKTRLEDYE